MFDTFPQTSLQYKPRLPSGSAQACALFLGEPSGNARVEKACVDLGLAVVTAADVADARRRMDAESVALVILSPLAGGQTDYSACHELSRLGAAPLLVFSDTDSATDRILALELGADDWIAAACCDRELAARLRAAMRRTFKPTTTHSDDIRIGGWRVNRSTGEARHDRGGRSVLSKSELIILNLFIRKAGSVVGRPDIHQALGGDFDVHGVTVHVFRLRKKLAAGADDLIRTIRGVGYVMDRPVTEA